MIKRIISIILTALMTLSVCCFASADGTYDGECRKEKSEGADIRVMSYNLLADSDDFWWGSELGNRPEGAIACIRYYMPDVIGLQEVSKGWYSALREGLGDTYEFVNPDWHGGRDSNCTAMMYNRNTVSLVSSEIYDYSVANTERLRLINLGVFKRNWDGTKFMVTSTHLDPASDRHEQRMIQVSEWISKVKSYVSKNRCPLVSTGDMNCLLSSDEYRTIAASGIVTDLESDPEDGIVDHMFGTSGVTGVYTVFVHDGEIASSSDHWPMIADVKLPNTPVFTSGDVDSDGDITVADALLALRYSLGLAKPNTAKKLAADADRNGRITVYDAVQILRYAAKLQNGFNIVS